MSTAVKKIRVDSADLLIGMYVCELDRPWLDTPFMIQGFYIKDDRDIDTVRDICDYVYVDKAVESGQLSKHLPSASSAVLMTGNMKKPSDAAPVTRVSRAAEDKARSRKSGSEEGIADFFPNRKLTSYTDTASWRDESRNARQVIADLYHYVSRIMESSRHGDPVNLANIKQKVEPMVSSVIRNPDGCLWMTAMKPAENDLDDAALRASVFAVVLGRQLGLPKRDLCSLAVGGLLFDIGKLQLDDNILYADRKLTAPEMAAMQGHVEASLEILKTGELTDPDIIDFVAHHHERFDASGYPQGLGGDMIPAFGRIAGLVDCYNAITGSRRYASTRSPAEAINQLYKLKSVHFHKDLIEEFIQAIGVYPVGALVELSSGEVAIVVAQSRTRRLRPMVAVLLDGNKRPSREGGYIKLEKVTHSDDGRKLDIVKNLEPNAYDIDLAKLKAKIHQGR